jgi:hypothetical protein
VRTIRNGSHFVKGQNNQEEFQVQAPFPKLGNSKKANENSKLNNSLEKYLEIMGFM